MTLLSRLPRQHLAIFAAYLGIAVIITWPLITVFSNRLIGHPFGDTYEYIGLTWWFKHALQTGAPLFFQPLLAYPDGLSAAYLWGIPLQSFPTWLFALVMPLPAAFNLTILLTLALNGWSAFFLVAYLTKNRPAAWVSGIVFMAYPAFQGHLAAGHIGLLQQWAVPLYLYALFRLRSVNSNVDNQSRALHYSPSPYTVTEGKGLGGGVNTERRWIIYAALFFIISLLGSSLNLIYMLFPLTAVFLLVLLFKREWAALSRTMLALLLGGLLSLIFLFPVMLDNASTPVRLREAGSIAFSADLLGIISPSFQHPLFSRLGYPHQVLGVDPFEKIAYIGIAAGLLSLLALWRRPSARIWLIVGLLAWILSLGPVLKILDAPVQRVVGGYATLITLPWMTAQSIPLLNISRTPARFNFVLALVVAVLAGYGMSVLWDRLSARRLRWLLPIVASALILYEYPFFWTNGLLDMPTLPGEVPPPIAALSEQDNIRAVFDIPWDHLLTDKEAMFLQTGHQHPILAGHIARRTPVDPARLAILQQTLDLALLNAAGADIIILHKQWDDAEGQTEAFARAQLGEPSYQDENYAVFTAPEIDEPPVFTTVLSTQKVVTDHADSYIYTPAPGWVILSQTLQADGLDAILSLNGTPLHKWFVDGELETDVPLFLPEAGYYTVSLALEPACPAIANPALTCRSLEISDLSLSDFLETESVNPITFEHGVTLNAAHVNYDQDSGLSIWLDWKFAAPRTETDIRFVHVVDEAGNLVAQEDTTLGVQAAGEGWSEAITLPTDLLPGEYQVYVGWYAYPDTTPFPILTDVPNAQSGALSIGTFSIE